MGKHGPCYHCGVTSTLLWRNGPPDKPVLCNACGSRWRTKGTLVNYTPQHSRAEQPDKIEDYRVFKVKPVSIKNNPAKVLKRKIDTNIVRHGAVLPLTDYYKQKSWKGFDEVASNRSSSGSAISNNSESYLQYGSPDASDLTGPSSQPDVWEMMVPSKKRTCVTRSKPSSVEKLTKDLYTIWQEQQQSSCLSVCSEDDLLFETDKPMVSVEIGHGSVLIRHQHSVAPEEESEASSLSIDHKLHTVNSQLTVSLDGNKRKGVGFSDGENEKLKNPANQGVEKERILRDKDEHEKLLILAHHGSPLCHIDLQDVINFDTFTNHLTNDEQQQLLKYLPSLDTLDGSRSVENMFDMPQFKDNLLSLQKLVVDGVFDNSLCGISTDDVRTLKKLVLSNLTKSKWVEKYQSIKDLKGSNSINESEAVRVFNSSANNHSESRNSRGGQHQTGGKVTMNKIIEKISCNKDLTDKDGTFISSRSLFSSLNDNGSLVEDIVDDDLLLHVPCNTSFPQAELLILPTSSSSSVYRNLFCL